mmetsp:Transcript_29302/g.71356  ORF Transcript_29302/g.71356 Transcript_29302/m.71356 type:complete len:171 (+) Transcript_29302:106-618(+)
MAFTIATGVVPAASVRPQRAIDRKSSTVQRVHRRAVVTCAQVGQVEADAIIGRISKALPEFTSGAIAEALLDHNMDEEAALAALTARSSAALSREETVEKYRQNGVNRISAMEEAAFRRKATGSASEFFKSSVEVEGQYVENGYVDEGADAMGDLMKRLGGLKKKFLNSQ